MSDAKPMTGTSVTTIGMAKKTMRVTSELNQNAVWRCEKVRKECDKTSNYLPVAASVVLPRQSIVQDTVR
jgi:hypothetical protein